MITKLCWALTFLTGAVAVFFLMWLLLEPEPLAAKILVEGLVLYGYCELWVIVYRYRHDKEEQ